MTPEKPSKWPESRIITYAKDQPEYIPLPAALFGDEAGTIVTQWRLSRKERLVALLTGRIKISMLTFGNALQPIRPYVIGDEDEYELQHIAGWQKVEELRGN